jgi:hypothetical protein
MRLATTPSRAPPAAWSQRSALPRSHVGGQLQAFCLVRRFVKAFENNSARLERFVDQALARRIHKHVEQDEKRRSLYGELLDPALGGMDAHLQGGEG